MLALLLGSAGAFGCDSQGGSDGVLIAGASSGSWTAIQTQKQGCPAGGCAAPPVGVYVIGSSYSWDALPRALDNAPEWHVFCAKSLDYIFDFPDDYCVADSLPWPDVLDPPAKSYGYIAFQPVKAATSTLILDVDHIGYWLADQPPSTVGIIHTTWPSPASWEAELHDSNPDNRFTNYSLDYYYALQAKLELANPGRTFVLTRANEMMDYIFHDPQAPILFDDLLRDTKGHMSLGCGRYLQHNAFRKALGQPTGVDSTANGAPANLRSYLDAVVDLY